jgi:hypothetical protein
VPTTAAGLTALAGVSTAINNFISTVNTKGSSLATSDVASYVDSNFLNDGLNANKWETLLISYFSPVTVSLSGFTINSLDTTNNIADVTIQLFLTEGSTTTPQNINLIFKENSSSVWVMYGNQKIATAYASTWAWFANTPSNSLRFEVDDPNGVVTSVTVTGPGIPANFNGTVPVVCDNSGALSSVNCGNAYAEDTQRAFQYYVQDYWPPLGSTYTFTVAVGSTKYTYTSMVGVEFGGSVNSSGIWTSNAADAPKVTFNSAPSFATVLGGVTVHGKVLIPIWAMGPEAPHYNYEGDDGTSNSVSNQVIDGTWDSGVGVPGQWNNFTIVIPKATGVTSGVQCPVNTSNHNCYTITFKGFTDTVEASGWFGMDAQYQSNGGGNMNPSSSTNNGLNIF